MSPINLAVGFGNSMLAVMCWRIRGLGGRFVVTVNVLCALANLTIGILSK